MLVGEEGRYSKTILLSFVKHDMSVSEMAVALNADIEEVIACYAQYSQNDRNAFPLKLLLTKEWLENELQTSKVADICRKAKTNPSVVKSYCKKYGIQNKQMLKYILTEDLLYDLFVKQRMTDGEIASTYNCSLESVKKLRSKYGIDANARADATNHITIELFHRLFVEYGFTIQQLSELLGCTQYAVRTMQQQFESGEGKLSEEIRQRKKYFAFQDLIEAIMEILPPLELYEKLKCGTLAAVAEENRIIPLPIQGVETFSVDWFRVITKSMSPSNIIKTYHLGKAFVRDTIAENKLDEIKPEKSMDEKLVKTLYCENRWSDEEIAHLLNVPVYLVVTFRKKYGIKRSKQYTAACRLTQDDFINLYIKEDLTIAQIAEIYDISEKTVSSIKSDYSKHCTFLASHKSRGAVAERVAFLKKRVKFQGFNSSSQTEHDLAFLNSIKKTDK